MIKSSADLLAASLQTIYDQAAGHLLQQRKRCGYEFESSVNSDGFVTPGFVCKFSNPKDGTRCAVGVFLSADELDTAIAHDWNDPMELPLWEKLSSDQSNLLDGLRNIHDEAPVEEWEDQLLNLANDLGLLTHTLREDP